MTVDLLQAQLYACETALEIENRYKDQKISPEANASLASHVETAILSFI